MFKSLKIFLALVAMAFGLSFGTAQAAPIQVDSFAAPQTELATSLLPVDTSTLPASVVGVAPFLGDRTLTATLTSPTGTVGCNIGNGIYEVSRTVSATGGCLLEYDVVADFGLGNITFMGQADAAFGGTSSLRILKNGLLIAEQVLSTVLQAYVLNTFDTVFLATDFLGFEQVGAVATDSFAFTVNGDITRVSEPGGLALLVLALLVLVSFTHRRPAAVRLA